MDRRLRHTAGFLAGGGDTPSPTPDEAHYKEFATGSGNATCLCDQNGTLVIINDGSVDGALVRSSNTEYEFTNSYAQTYTGEKKTVASFSSELESFEWGGVVFTHTSRNYYEASPAPTSL